MKGEPPTSSLPNYHAKLSENPAFTQLEPDPSIWGKMTKRERQAFIGVCEGLSDKQIAFRYEIAPTTVKVHLRNLRRRVGIVSRVGLVMRICRLKAPPLAAIPKEVVSRETERAA